MARTRHARWKARSGEERISEYELALQGRDRPAWSEDKIKKMADNARDVYSILAQLDEKVRHVCGTIGIPSHRWIDMMRIVRRAWRLKHAGVPKNQYDEEIGYMARKYGFTVDQVNRVLQECSLPPIGAGAGVGAGVRVVP